MRRGRSRSLAIRGHGVWIESVIPDESGTWYGYYHHERAAEACGRMDRFIPRIGALRSRDRGYTWEDLGIIVEAPPDTAACTSTNRFVIGGVGDVSAMLSPDRQDLFLFSSQYSRIPSDRGVAVGRLAWADRDAPVGRVTVWRDNVWMPARPAVDANGVTTWSYQAALRCHRSANRGTTAMSRPTRSGGRPSIGISIWSDT